MFNEAVSTCVGSQVHPALPAPEDASRTGASFLSLSLSLFFYYFQKKKIKSDLATKLKHALA